MESEALQSTLDGLSHLVIPPSQLTFDNDAELGFGGYGEVYLAVLARSPNTPPQKVAVKQLRIVQAREVRRRIAMRLARELKVWATAKHPNILELVGFYLGENYGSAQFVSTYMAHGNVKDYIKKCQPSVVIRLNFVRGLTSGINYLHTCDPPICHGDLKPSNVLVNDNVEAVLCDFGLATFIEDSGVSSGLTTSKSVKGSTRYMSPELLQDSGAKHTLGSDVWAWACTAFEILTDCEPYRTAAGDVGVIKSLVLGKCPGSVDMISNLVPGTDTNSYHTLDSLRLIITECWVSDSAERPSSSDIINRLFFQSDVETSDAFSNLDELGDYNGTGSLALTIEKGPLSSDLVSSSRRREISESYKKLGVDIIIIHSQSDVEAATEEEEEGMDQLEARQGGGEDVVDSDTDSASAKRERFQAGKKRKNDSISAEDGKKKRKKVQGVAGSKKAGKATASSADNAESKDRAGAMTRRKATEGEARGDKARASRGKPEDGDVGPGKESEGKDDADDPFSNDPDAQIVRRWRHRLQKMFLTDGKPQAEDMPQAGQILSDVENYPNMKIEYLVYSKIGKVISRIAKFPEIPREDEYHIKERAMTLYRKWSAMVLAAEQAAKSNEGTSV